MLPCSSVSFGAGSVPQSLLLRGTCLSAGYEPRRATDHGPRLLPGHGDAEPLLGVNEMVVVVDAKVDLDPMDLAGEALLRVLACPGSAHCVVALVQNALKPSKMPPFKPDLRPSGCIFGFSAANRPHSAVFSRRERSTAPGKLQFVVPRCRRPPFSLPNVRHQPRRMAAQPDYLSEWLSSRRVLFSTALDGSRRLSTALVGSQRLSTAPIGRLASSSRPMGRPASAPMADLDARGPPGSGALAPLGLIGRVSAGRSGTVYRALQPRPQRPRGCGRSSSP